MHVAANVIRCRCFRHSPLPWRHPIAAIGNIPQQSAIIASPEVIVIFDHFLPVIDRLQPSSSSLIVIILAVANWSIVSIIDHFQQPLCHPYRSTSASSSQRPPRVFDWFPLRRSAHRPAAVLSSLGIFTSATVATASVVRSFHQSEASAITLFQIQ